MMCFFLILLILLLILLIRIEMKIVENTNVLIDIHNMALTYAKSVEEGSHETQD